MVLVVGGCAEGFQPENNIHADLLYTLGDATDDDMQVGGPSPCPHLRACHAKSCQEGNFHGGMGAQARMRSWRICSIASWVESLKRRDAQGLPARAAAPPPCAPAPTPLPTPLCLQFFWEAFPAEGGTARTTYMFAYSDAQPARPNFEALLDRYFNDLVEYQVGVVLQRGFAALVLEKRAHTTSPAVAP